MKIADTLSTLEDILEDLEISHVEIPRLPARMKQAARAIRPAQGLPYAPQAGEVFHFMGVPFRVTPKDPEQ